MEESTAEQVEKLRSALATLEAQRALLGDAIEPAIVLTRQQLETLEAQQRVAAPPSAEERRLITILFTDIVDSTSLAERLDPEDWRQTISKLHFTVGNSIAEHRGQVAQYLGDGLLAFFGAYQSSEQDAENASRAALEIRDAVSNLDSAQRIQIRIGIHTGLVVIGELGAETHKEFAATGDAMNLAARLQSAAPPGGILISHDTYRFVRGVFDVTPQPLLLVKGKTEPIQTYLVQRAKPRAFRTTSRGMSDIQTRTIGRTRELEQLQHIYLDALQNNRTAWVLLRGEPGVGKSRLVQDMQEWIDLQSQRVRLLVGRAFANEQLQPFSLVRHLWFDRFEIADDLPIAQAEAKWVESFRELTGIAAQEPAHALGLLVGLPFRNSPYIGAMRDDPAQVKGRAFVVSRQILRAIREQMPLLVLLEDLHWADQASLEYLQQVVLGDDRRSRATEGTTHDQELQGMFVLATARNEWDFTFEKGDGFISMPLAPLSNEGARVLASELLRNVPNVPAHAIDLIVERAEGVPYFAEEMVNYFLDRGIIDRSVEPWQFNPERLHETPLPTTLQYLLRARLDALAQVQRTALQRGAVYGRHFWSSGIEAMGVAGATEILKPLQPRGLVELQPESAFADECEWSFHHALLRDVTYESILKRERAALHERAAEWLKTQATAVGRLDEFAGLLGEHYERANQPGVAAQWLVRAGERAQEQGAPREAKSFFDRALELLPTSETEMRWRALVGREQVLVILDEREQNLADVNTLLVLADELDDDGRRAEALYRQAYAALRVNNFRLCLQAAEQAVAVAQRAGNEALALRASSFRANALRGLGDWQAALQLTQVVLAQARAYGKNPVLWEVLENAGMVHTYSGDLTLGVELQKESAEIAQGIGNLYGATVALGNLGWSYAELGLYHQARATLDQALALGQAIGARRRRRNDLRILGVVYFRLGDGPSARLVLDECIQECSTLGDVYGRAEGMWYLALEVERSGDFAGAARRYQEAVDGFITTEAHAFEQEARAGLVRCALRQGWLEEARGHVTKVWQYLCEHGAAEMDFPVWAYLTCTALFLELGDAENSRTATEAGYRELMKRAEKISNAEWRKSFLENVPEHWAMVEMWKGLSAEKG